MKTDDRLENVGGIRGRAYVMFGGKVVLGTFNDGERFGGIAFAELLDKKNVGDDISNKEHYDAQVYIEVKSLESLQALRDVLDMCESALKDQLEKDRLDAINGAKAKTGMPVAKRVFGMDMDEKGNVQMHGEIPPYMSIQLKDGVYFVYEDIDGSRRCELFDGKNEKENIQYIAFKFGAVSLKLWGEDLGEVPLTTKKEADDDSGYITSYAKAACDFNGKRWTELLVEHGLSFELPKDEKNEWYIPAIGELYVMYIFKNYINDALKYAKRKPLKDAWYWSSTEYSATYAWNLNFGSGGFYSGGSKTHEGSVRPVSAFNPLSF